MKSKKIEKALKLFARADLRRAQKQGSEIIQDTAFGTLEIKFIKASKTYRISARVGEKTVEMGEFIHREAERIVASSYVVLQETPA